jgi:hypothetical protein
MGDFWDPRTWPDACLRSYAARKPTCDIERAMIPAAQEELRIRERERRSGDQTS